MRQESDVFRTDIDARDADRRFFRNFLLVLLGVLVITAVQLIALTLAECEPCTEEIQAVRATVFALFAVVVVIVLSAYRYVDQDTKYTRSVFESLLAIDAAKRLSKNPKRQKTRKGQ